MFGTKSPSLFNDPRSVNHGKPTQRPGSNHGEGITDGARLVAASNNARRASEAYRDMPCPSCGEAQHSMRGRR